MTTLHLPHATSHRRCAWQQTPTRGRPLGLSRRLQRVRSMPSPKDSDISTKDWRAQRMSDAAHAFFEKVWSRGEVDLLDKLITDDFAYKDAVWAAQRPVVGAKAFKTYVEAMRTAYPDLMYELQQVGVSDPRHVFVHWTCHGTNLQPLMDDAGLPHRPTFHESHISGIDFLTFNDDRSRIQEVLIYRQPTLEERQFLKEEALAEDRLAIRLERLHWDRPRSNSSSK